MKKVNAPYQIKKGLRIKNRRTGATAKITGEAQHSRWTIRTARGKGRHLHQQTLWDQWRPDDEDAE